MSFDQLLASGFGNHWVVEELYEKYQNDPDSVDPSWHSVFKELDGNGSITSVPIPPPALKPLPAVVPFHDRAAEITADLDTFNLINAYRMHGHLIANVNPLTLPSAEVPHELQIETWGFTQEDLNKDFPTCGILEKKEAPLSEIIKALRFIYCNNIGIEYIDTIGPEMERWVQKQIEPSGFTAPLSIEQKQLILQHLNKSELFESFLQTKYVGQKRFSLEGGETLIPILASLVEEGAENGVVEFVIGMAHRGRLNVLSNILDKSYADIFSEFEENYIPESFEGSGDVKYHKGFSSSIITAKGHRVNVSLPPNPSHLESVNPVVQGQVRSLQKINGKKVLPILIHGDAALSGQGVVYETMQMSQLEGYQTGGTVHIVINNQIGFTTIPEDGRSTYYCTDLARAFRSPVFHVNAEDPEGCVYAMHLAFEIQQKFSRDVFIDLICYRKYGHNESDEPAFTQPHEYQEIRKKKPIREIFRDQLIQEGLLEKYLAEQLEGEFKKALQRALQGAKSQFEKPISIETKEKAKWYPEEVDTSVRFDELREVGKRICTVPKDFHVHRKLKQLLDQRWAMVESEKDARPIDWGMAEHLAFGTLLFEGHHIRLSGQDCARGTFSHRHAVWMEQEAEKEYIPLQHLKPGQGEFSVYNSPLSEYAVLGFEFGYSMSQPEALVVWEAQFGDFANGAQIIIDQYISTAEQKWAGKANLTLFLPHGYEGQGPEHSSARMERFLILCGDGNMQMVNPTTPAQLFHLIRRQVLHKTPKPLIVFTPKGLLRHPKCISSLDDLSKGSFQVVIRDSESPLKPKRIAFCSGRIYYDLLEEREKRGNQDLVLIRIEQLYPFPSVQIEKLIAEIQGINEYLWIQEEPKNMGAYHFIRPYLQKRLPKGKALKYIGRKRSASPAVGSYALHKKEYANLMREVFPSLDEDQDLNIHHMQRV